MRQGQEELLLEDDFTREAWARLAGLDAPKFSGRTVAWMRS
jgi:hypothetical protein